VLERVEAGEALALDPDHVESFVDLYVRHIEREETELLPMAVRLLSDGELDVIGRAMRERRGIFQTK
jgi:hemerythrin-like domain-containing protein